MATTRQSSVLKGAGVTSTCWLGRPAACNERWACVPTHAWASTLQAR